MSVPSPSKLMRIIPPNSVREVDLSKKRGFLVRISIDRGTKGNQELQEILGVYFIHTLANAINLESHWNAFSKASLAKFYFIKEPTVRVKHKLHS